MRALSAILIFCILLPAYAQDALEGWRRAGSTDKDVVYFQLKSVRITDTKTVKAWIRYQYKRKQYEQLKEYEEANGSVEGFDDYKYDYILQLQEFNCRERRSRTHSSMRYDVGSKYLGGVQDAAPTWFDVIPDSIGESILDKVCLYPYEILFDDLPPARPKAKPGRHAAKRKRP
jgi:hypothetical protein